MKFRLKWSELDYSMDYTKKLPPQIKNIKVTKTDKYMCGPEERIACPAALSVLPVSGTPHASSRFSPKPPASRCRSHVLTCGSHETRPRTHTPHCGQAGRGPRAPGDVQPVPGHSAIQETV